MIFKDRRDAGRALADLVVALPDLTGSVVLGLARGGVPVAFEVARVCGLPLDVMMVRKLGVPRQEELAMGAIASGGEVVLNRSILREFWVNEDELEGAIERERRELERREIIYRGGRAPIAIDGRGVILVDDGLATGASMRAAARSVRGRARQVTIAVPVGAKSTCADLKSEADRVICAVMPEPFEAVGMFYEEFGPTSDEEVKELLEAGNRE
jgi:putative phosphoribosyl transferase